MLFIFLLLLGVANSTSPLPPKPVCPGYQEPSGPVECGPNAYFTRCPTTCSDLCPPTVCPCGVEKDCCTPKCVCNEGYLRNDKTGLCIKKKDCPIVCGDNEHTVTNSTTCRKTCGNRIPYTNEPCKPFTGCVCDDGYVRPYDNATGSCIPVGNCPKIPEKCGLNEVAASCKVKCPPQSCEISYTSYLCLPSECEPGCNCIKNFLRNASNICIFKDDCPVPGSPATTSAPSDADMPPITSPPSEGQSVIIQTSSQSSSNSQSSSSSSSQSSSTATSGNGSWTSESDSSSSSSLSSSSSSSSSSSTIIIGGKSCSLKCRPTCAVPNPPNCPYKPYNASDPCSCKKGYILSKKAGKCIRIEACPVNLGCNGDSNAIIRSCPQPCPSTCSRPNAIQCRKKCEPVGCECKEGYILSKYNGKCILPDKCPGGNPCGANETFASCKYNCPSDYCPAEDILRYPVCEVPIPCSSGCICKQNYKRKSTEDPTCILAKTCPPVQCTRPYEEWNPCRPFCPRIDCEEVNKFCSGPFIPECEPRCTCIEGYFRNRTEICVPLSECPPPTDGTAY